MKIRIFKMEGGGVQLIVRKTRPWESPTRSATVPAGGDVEAVLAKLVGEMGSKLHSQLRLPF